MQLLRRIPLYTSQLFLAYMPFHIFLSQWVSVYTGGLDVWKMGKDVLLIGAVMFTICLVLVQGKVNRVFKVLVGFAVLYGAMHVILWALNPDIYGRSAMLGTVYNVRLPLLFILGYGAVLLVTKFAFSSVIKLIIGVSSVVAAFGVLQFFLPQDLMTHFGYGIERGARALFLIDDKSGLLRVMSTLREPNALGAYLLVPIALLTSLLLRPHDAGRRYMLAGLLGVHLLALFLTFSRSSWLGAVLVIALVSGWQFRTAAIRILQRFWPVLACALVVVGIGLFSIRSTPFFQQYVVHSNPNEQVKDLDSNDYHWLFVKQGVEGIVDRPLGHGPGTAGLASIQNPAGSFLTENYYVQVGYEIGVAGLALFIALNAWLYRELWRWRSEWTVPILAAFWAYVLTNMLLHTWANEAVAAQWWILAGMLLAVSSTSPTIKKTRRVD